MTATSRNTHRVRKARQALRHYDDISEANVIDLLADLQNYCRDKHRTDPRHTSFDDALRTARMHFEAETGKEA